MNVDRTRDFERFNENEDDVRFRKKEKAPKTVSVQNEHQQTVISSANGAKVLKSIDDAIVEYEKEEKTKEKTFLSNLSKILNASQHGSKSQYATFEAMNGKVFTIRLANHNAKVSNFNNHEESEGISIVITSQKNNGVTNDGDAHIVEFFYDSIKIIERDTQNVPRLTKQKVENTFGGIWIDDVQEFAKFVSAVNNTPFEENGEGIAYTDNYFYAYYLNNAGNAIPFASVYLNAEEGQDVVKQVNQEIKDGRKNKGAKEYFDTAAKRYELFQSQNNANNGNNSISSNRGGNLRLGNHLLRKGRYFDHPSLYVKTQRVDRFGLIEDYSR